MARSRGVQPALAAALAALMTVPAVAVTIASRHGLGLSPDSVFYVSAARAVATSGQLTDLSGTPLTLFPPGLPLLLGAAQWTGIEATAAARLLNIGGVAITVLLSYLLARLVLHSRGWALAVAAVVSLSSSTTQVFSMLWTEPLFVVAVVTTVLLLTRAVLAQRISWWGIAAVAVAVWCATALRFTGATLLPVVMFGTLLARRRDGWPRAATVAVAATCFSALGLAAIAARNIALGTPALGERFGSGTTLPEILDDTLTTVGRYVVPTTAAGWLVLLIGGLLAALAVYAGLRAVATRDWAVVLLAGYLAVYLAFLIYGHLTATVDPVDFRLLAPVFTTGLILVCYALLTLVAAHGAAWRVVAVAALALTLVANLISLVPRAARSTAADNELYNSPAMRDSALAASLAGLPPGGIAATDPVRAYWVSGRVPSVQIPRRDYYWPPARTAADLEALRRAAASKRIAFAAFFDLDTTAVTPRDVQDAGIGLRLLRTFADGSLWAVS